ncbi:Anoctamin-8 [Fukomys damarensis]|uniref:Anoctamin n=1 Tax=Fukomys damarensis TaxID=885580 RepID=A0A091CY45_FUKDA|nr:Anoctamin-8 [Fukomys damarensis]
MDVTTRPQPARPSSATSTAGGRPRPLCAATGQALSTVFNYHWATHNRPRPQAEALYSYKLFGKRLLQAGRYLVSHKAWMKTVPTENCDVLMTFPDTTDDHTLLWLLNHIRVGIPELIVQVRHHRRTRAYAFFVTATLLRGADELGLRKAVKAEFGGGTRGFSCEEDFIYENVESELRFFTSQERQSIIRFWLQNLRAKQGEALHNVRFLEDQPISERGGADPQITGSEMGGAVPELAARGIIQQVFPVHEQRILNRLMKSWVQAVCENQPLDDICDYFGVKIAMYFAWLGFYTSAMVYPAVFGSVLYTFTEADQTSRDVSCVVFALFNVIWSTLFLEEWKRRGAELAYKWGTLDSPGEAMEEPRPQFRELVLSVKGLPRLARFLPKVVLALLVSVSAEGYKKLAIWLNDMENYRLESAYEKHLVIKVVLVSGCGRRGAGDLLGLRVSVASTLRPQFQFVNSYLSLFYIGFYLKDMERLKESLERQLRAVLVPLVALRFRLLLLSLRGLLLSARAKDYEGGSRAGDRRCLSGGCGAPEEEEESTTVESRPTGEGGEARDGPGGAKEGDEEDEEDEDGVDEDGEGEDVGLLDCGLRLKKVSFAERGTRRHRPAPGPEALLDEGSPTMVEKGLEPGDTFQDYQEMFVQFGYVVLFSSAFPLAALCALVNNLIEIRSDAFKLCTGLQRPFGRRVESIGQWQKVMEAMGVLAIVVNCYLIGQCGQLQRLFPWLSPEAAIVSVVVLEHFALLLKYLIHVAVPDIPGWVAEEMAKLEYQRREAFKRHERQAQHRYQQQQRRRREEEERQRHAEHQARREREARLMPHCQPGTTAVATRGPSLAPPWL